MEDYKKKYEEALEKARKLDEDGCHVLRDVFPELQESEDERIRKALINIFKKYQNPKLHLNPNKWEGLEIPKILAWLEKQGKNNMGISEATKQELEDSLHKALEKETSESCNEFLEKQGEQILDSSAKTCKDEQKPTEWSEEDETTKNNISHIIRQYDKISKKENQPCWYVGDCLLWMQNIKDRVQPQLKQEWSGQDENMLQSVLWHVSNSISNGKSQDFRCGLTEWLKSLRPQNRWKPSDEQIEALHDAIIYVKDSMFPSKNVLKKLYGQLKKLRE